MYLDSPFDPAEDGIFLILGEVMAGPGSKEDEDLLDRT